jgi:hypothetical protein
MAFDPTVFTSAIEPFKALWQKLRIAGVAVLRNNQWISISARITLSHKDPEPELFIQPTSDLIGFSSDATLSALGDLLENVGTRGRFGVRAGNKDLEIFLTLAHANSETNAQKIQLGTPFSTLSDDHERSFNLGDNQFRLFNSNVESQYALINYSQFNVISSQLRVHTPPYNGLTELLTNLKLPFDERQNQTSLEIVAPLPFSMTC